MRKRAPTDFPVHNFVSERWSPRAFSEKPVPPEVLASLFEAARWAPSSSNEQPWTYIVATRDDTENFAKLVDVLVPGNSIWAKNAPVLALAVAHLTFAKHGTPNRNAQYDVGAGQRVADHGSHVARLSCAPDGGLRCRKSAPGFCGSARMGTHRGHRYWLSGGHQHFAGKFARARNRGENTKTAG